MRIQNINSSYKSISFGEIEGDGGWYSWRNIDFYGTENKYYRALNYSATKEKTPSQIKKTINMSKSFIKNIFLKIRTR